MRKSFFSLFISECLWRNEFYAPVGTCSKSLAKFCWLSQNGGRTKITWNLCVSPFTALVEWNHVQNFRILTITFLEGPKNTVLRIRDVYPGSEFFPSWIQDPGSKRFRDPGSRISDPGSRIQKQQQKRGVKNVIPFNVATNFTKFYIILVLKCWKKKCGPIFKEL